MRGFSSAASVARVRQNHEDSDLWYPLETDSGTWTNKGTAGTAGLTLSGTTLGQVAGPLGKGAYLYADAGYSGAASKTLGSRGCSIWAWIVPDKSGLVWGRYKTTDGSKILTMSITSEKLVVDVIGAGGTATATSDRPVIIGVPNLLGLVYDPEDSVTIAAYVNGIRSGENSSVGAITWSTETPGQCVWGGGLSAHTDECPGVYAELGGVSRVLDSSEFGEMWRLGNGYP
jgi:hypothetical protein